MKSLANRNRAPRYLVLAVLVIALAGTLTLAGCGKEEKAGTTSAKATTAPAAKATPIPRLQSEEFKRLPQKIQDAWTKWHPDNLKRPDPYKPIYGGVFRRTGSASMGTNFIKANQPWGYTIWNYVSVGLVRSKQNWGDDIVSPQPEPDVAESWSSNKDGTEWTFKIRDNVFFQNLPPVNGRKLTASDVKWWWDTVRKDAYFAGEMAEITSVEAPDDRTVVVKSSKPFPDIINMLMYPHMVIFPKECWEDEKNCMQRMPVGLGAFQMKENTEQRMTMVRNPKFHLKDNGNALPYLDGIETIVVADAAARDAAWRTGQIDYFLARGGGSTLVDTFIKENPGVRVEMDGATQASYLSGLAIMFNFKNQGPWQDKRVRQALSLAINRERLCEVVNQGLCVVPFPVNFTELGRSFEFTWTDLPATMKYDPAKAKQLLADAGFPNGLTLDIQTSLTGDVWWLEVFKDWQAIGVKANQDKQQDLYLNASKRTFPAAQGTDSTPIGTRPKLYTWAMLHSQAPGNVESYNDPEMDKVLDDWRYTTDPEKRKQLSQQLFEMVSDRLPRIEIWDFVRFEVMQPWTINLACGSTVACVNQGAKAWAKVWLDPSAGLPAARKFEPRSAP